MGATLLTVYGAYTKFGRIFMGLANRLRKKNKPRHTNPDAGKQLLFEKMPFWNRITRHQRLN